MARQFHGRVLARQGFEKIVARTKCESGLGREAARKDSAEPWVGIDAGADGSTALRKLV